MTRHVPAAIALAAAALALSACSAGSSASSPAASAPAPAATSAAAPDATLGPLTLGAFPATTDGRLAKAICQAWSGLRAQYAANAQNDSPVQLNQWFSGPAWDGARADAVKLGNATAYAGLEAAYGVATVGDTASVANALLLDKACAKG